MVHVASGIRSAILASALLVELYAQPQDERAKQIDDIFQTWNNSTGPGAAVAVVHKGQLVFQKGYGLANVEYGIPIQPDSTIFHVASVSKQFTAMALVLLEIDGKLSLDDDIRKHLPELPNYGHPITIRNLLQHTSGIRDQWQTLALAGWSLEDVITQDQILRMLFRQKELNFAPGSEHLYSNGGFTLAAEIVARVSGKPFPEFFAERIFQPLGMVNTHFHQDLRQIVKNRAYSYSGTALKLAYSPLNYANAGATSLFTTATDLTKWLDNFRAPKIGGGQAAVLRLLEQAVLSNGKKIDYALGVSIGKFRGLPTVSHGGSDAGYRSYVSWFPDQQLGVAVVSNVASFNSGSVANRVATVFLESMRVAGMTPVTPAPAAASASQSPIALDAEKLKAFTGTYPLPRISQTLVAVVENGKLLAAGAIQPPMELKPVGPSRFYVEQLSADIEFLPLPDGGMKVKITQPGAVNEGTRNAGEVKKPDLSQYTGAYWSDELETQYTFAVKDGKLGAMHAHHGAIKLEHTTQDSFSANRWFIQEVAFQRNGEGLVTGMTVGGGRVRGVRFVKK